MKSLTGFNMLSSARGTKTQRACAVLLVAALSGCASGGSSVMAPSPAATATPKSKVDEQPGPASPFPSHRELTQLAAKAAPSPSPEAHRVDAPGFELVGELPDIIADVSSGASAATQSVHDFAATRSDRVAVSEAMNCFARQLATLRLTQKGSPSLSLIRFLAARCGSTARNLDFTVLHGPIPKALKTTKVVKGWSEQWPAILEGLKLPPVAVIGSAFVRRKSKAKPGRDDAAFVVAWGRKRARVEPFARTPDGTTVVIEGELLVKADRLHAVATRGHYGVAVCDVDAGTKLPKFRVTCPVSKDDDHTWIDIISFEPGRILGPSALTAVVSPTHAPHRTYRRRQTLLSTAQMERPEAVRAALLELVNGVRRKAGLPPFVLAPAQSDLVQKLAPHYFGALVFNTLEETTADRIVMGLRAGWAVPGSVRHGTTTAAAVRGTRDLGELVSELLEMPVSRGVLLSPQATQLAIGTHSLRGEMAGFVGGLFAAYEIVASEAKTKLLRRVVGELNRQRGLRGLGPVLVEPGLEEARRITAEQLEAGYKNAVRTLMNALGSQANTGSKGWTMVVNDLSGMRFPEELLARSAPRIAVTAAIRRPPGSPWVVVQVVFAMATAPNSHMLTL